MEIRVPLADLDYGEEESQAVLDVLNKRWLTMGTVTQEFESQFAKMAGVKHALAVSNGTAALHLACLILGIGPGDEVILPSLTFVATANAVLYTGAEARFADIIGQEELNISPESIEKQITARTKALILMHYGGYPCRMREILERMEQGQGRHGDIETLQGLADSVFGTCLCPMGDAAVNPIRSGIAHFREEYEYHIAHGKCMV